MLGFWDWEGTHKIVTTGGGHVSLVGSDVSFSGWADWWRDTTGRLPAIACVYAVSQEFYEQWKDTFAGKDLLCEEDVYVDKGEGL